MADAILKISEIASAISLRQFADNPHAMLYIQDQKNKKMTVKFFKIIY